MGSSFESNCFCQLNPICQHDFGSILWQSPGGIQLFQELVKNHFIVPFRPFVCRWDKKAAQANIDLACAQQQNFTTSAVCATEVGMACLFWQSHAHVQKNLERLKQTPDNPIQIKSPQSPSRLVIAVIMPALYDLLLW